MSSPTTTRTDEKTAGGGGIFIALAPWVLFTLVASHGSLKVASVLALVAAIGIAAPATLARRPKLLEVGAVATFIGFTIVAFAASPDTADWVARYARGIAAAVLALIAFASLAFVPFTEQYAREQVPEAYWGSAHFKEANRKLTLMWGCIFAAMVPFHIIAGTIDTRAGNVVFNWVIPIALVVWGAKRSTGERDDAPAVHAA
jgi:hypothetical protein